MGTVSDVIPGRLYVPKRGWEIEWCDCGTMFLKRVEEDRTACYVCEPPAPEKRPSDAPKHGMVRNQHPR